VQVGSDQAQRRLRAGRAIKDRRDQLIVGPSKTIGQAQAWGAVDGANDHTAEVKADRA
jgi:hypothetical protein